ncbi:MULTISPECIES: hypothetical protein [unclassified Gilliamella]|nr:hypothetical protein [Gilliamella apicola]
MLTNKALFEYIEIYYYCMRGRSAKDWVLPEQYEQQYTYRNLF